MKRRKARVKEAETWAPRSERPRVLIEDADGASQWALGKLLSRAGYDVATCDGPERMHKGNCPLVTEGHCTLAEGADVILNKLPLTHEANRDLLAALGEEVPDTPVLVEVTQLRAEAFEDTLCGFRVISSPAGPDAIINAVNEAVADGDDEPAERGSDRG